jgi:hypothetical protein
MASISQPDRFFNLSVWSSDPVTYENKGATKTGDKTISVPSGVSVVFADCAQKPAEGEEDAVNGDLILNLADSNTFGQVVTFAVLNAATNNDVVINFTGHSSSIDTLTIDTVATIGAPVTTSLVWMGSFWSLLSRPNIDPAVS